MKKKHRPLPLRILLILSVYIVGLAIFVSASCMPQVMRTLDRQDEKTQRYIEQYLTGTLSNPLKSSDTKLLIYNTKGEPVEFIDSVVTPPAYICEKEIVRYFENGNLAPERRTVIFQEQQEGNFDERIDFVVFIARPIIESGEVTGVAFLEKDMVSLIFFIEDSFRSFTLIYAIAMICILITAHKTRKLRQLQQNYIDNITHELKSPIAAIKGLATALSDHEMSHREQSQYFGLIFSEANRQEKMVQNILELSRIQAHGMSFKKTEISARELFEPLCEKYESLCDDLDMNWNESEELFELPTLYTNAECISKLFDVLVNNAIKFTQPNGSISLSAVSHSSHISVCIRDNGPGIPKNQLPHVFDRFYRGESSYNKGGNGLGLAIAKEITNGLHEKIWAESVPGSGAAFYFTISTAKK